MTMGDLQAMNDGSAGNAGQPTMACYPQHVPFDRQVKVIAHNARQRHNDQELAVGLKNIEGRLPACWMDRRDARLEEPSMQMLGPLDHGQSLVPHPISQIPCGHRTASKSDNTRRKPIEPDYINVR